jgi:short-subunit dehydrogenase
MGYRCALITGATSGIGEAFARRLPPQTGLLLTGRDRGRLDALAGELASAGRTVRTLAADLAEDGEPERLSGWAQEGEVDLLISNAGFGRFGPFTKSAPEDGRAMVMVNVLAPVVLARALVPGMIARARATGRRFGVIVVASAAGFAPVPLFATYAATKAFDLSFAAALASELTDEPGDVLALCPGSTRTRFFERAGFPGERLGVVHEPGRVAEEGLAALGRRTVHVVGPLNRGYALGTRLLPGGPLRALTRFAMERLQG